MVLNKKEIIIAASAAGATAGIGIAGVLVTKLIKRNAIKAEKERIEKTIGEIDGLKDLEILNEKIDEILDYVEDLEKKFKNNLKVNEELIKENERLKNK